MNQTYDVIVTVVNRGNSDDVVTASREAGARGATIFYGRGMGVHEQDSFLGISLQPEKEIILTLTTTENRNRIIQAICAKAALDVEGNGICFSLPVTAVRGIISADPPAKK